MTPIFSKMMQWAATEGWNQSDVAKRLGASPQTVHNWKKRDVPPEWYAPIAQLFGRSVDQLLGADEGPAKRRWPYRLINEAKFRNLKGDPVMQIEAALLLAAAQIGVDLRETDGDT